MHRRETVSPLWLLLALAIASCDSGGSASGDQNTPPPPGPASVERVSDYREWGWESLVLSNSYVTLAAVPEVGGRIMEYSLGGEESMWVNPDQLGTTPTPSPAFWPNHGGYKNWPAPQSRWNWPPPPILDYGEYEDAVVSENADSATIRLESGTEAFGTPGLRFIRTVTIYSGSSRVRVAQTLVNEGAEEASWSVWDITQNVVQHAPARDFDNFRVYFPINPESRFGADGVRMDRPSEAWAGSSAEGVYEVKFRPDNAKLFADSRGGWICYVDLRDGYAYAKTFPVFPEESYPDQGADVEVYVSNQNYVEVEVLSPIAVIPADGGSYTFTENWWAARTAGPVLDLNEIGLVNQPLRVDASTGRVSGRFGVFHAGLAYVVLYDANGAALARSDGMATLPTELLSVDSSMQPEPGATRAELVVETLNGERVGVLAAAAL